MIGRSAPFLTPAPRGPAPRDFGGRGRRPVDGLVPAGPIAILRAASATPSGAATDRLGRPGPRGPCGTLGSPRGRGAARRRDRNRPGPCGRGPGNGRRRAPSPGGRRPGRRAPRGRRGSGATDAARAWTLAYQTFVTPGTGCPAEMASTRGATARARFGSGSGPRAASARDISRKNSIRGLRARGPARMPGPRPGGSRPGPPLRGGSAPGSRRPSSPGARCGRRPSAPPS